MKSSYKLNEEGTWMLVQDVHDLLLPHYGILLLFFSDLSFFTNLYGIFFSPRRRVQRKVNLIKHNNNKNQQTLS